MTHKLFGIMDVKSKFFTQMFVEQFTPIAVRGFTTAVNKPDTAYHRYPDDFALFELADVDSVTGAIVPLTAPHSLGTARSFLESPLSEVRQ